MATILVTLPDDQEARILGALLAAYKYPSTVIGENGEQVQNPETPFDFSCRMMNNWFKELVKSVEVPDLAKADRVTRQAEIDAINIVIEEQ